MFKFVNESLLRTKDIINYLSMNKDVLCCTSMDGGAGNKILKVALLKSKYQQKHENVLDL